MQLVTACEAHRVVQRVDLEELPVGVQRPGVNAAKCKAVLVGGELMSERRQALDGAVARHPRFAERRLGRTERLQ